LERYSDSIEIVAVNDLVDPQINAHLLRYDTNYGPFPGTVEVGDGHMVVNGKKIRVFSESDPAKIPWGDAGVDVVIESTGFFTDGEKAAAHLKGGAKKVIISAPAKNVDHTIAMGVNHETYDPASHRIISNASCTTNGLACIAKVLHEEWGIEKGLLTTVHAYTNSQRLVDAAVRKFDDIRDARAAALNVVPAPTGAARAIGLVIPELQGRFDGMAFRVPVSTVSVIDFTAIVQKATSKEAINAAMKTAAEGPLKGILQYSEEPLVSTDLKGNSHSSIFSAVDTMALGGNFVKLVSWYDNEYGYSCRIADLSNYIVSRGV
jgi:glyceraldehyde 3-phosphate dehydrogenase